MVPNLEDSLFIIEAPGKILSWKQSLKKLGWENYKVKATKGRLKDLPLDNYGYKIDNNIIKADFVTLNDYIIQDLQKNIDKAKQVIIATDNDPEGEWIADEVASMCGEKSFFRISVPAILPELISRSLNNPQKIDKNTVSSVKSKRLLDRLIGYHPENTKPFRVGIGRVLAPVLSEYKNNPPKYFHAQLPLKCNEKSFEHDFFLQISVDYKRKDELLKVILDNNLTKNNLPSVDLINTITETEEIYPWSAGDALVNISESLNIGVKEVAENLQDLYEEADITYPRTHERMLSEPLSDHLNILSKDYDSVGYTQNKFKRENNIKISHDAIIPISSRLNYRKSLSTLSTRDKVLSLILRHTFRASQSNRVNYIAYGKINKNTKEGAELALSLRKFESNTSITSKWTERNGKIHPENDLFLPNGIKVKTKNYGLWETKTEPADLQILKLMIDNKLGQPSTYHIHASNIAKKFINETMGLKANAFLSLQKTSQLLPLLLDKNLAKKIESELFSNKETDISMKIENALGVIGESFETWKNKDKAGKSFDTERLPSS